MWLMEVTTAITGLSSVTPGTGDAKLLLSNMTTSDVEDWTAGDADAIVEHPVYSMLLVTMAVGELFHAIQDNFGTIWVVKRLSATRYRGQQVGALLTSDADNDIDNLVALDGIAFETTSVTADNVLNWEADDDAPTYIEFNATDGVWEMYNVECPA
jgi:hypothetical protein